MTLQISDNWDITNADTIEVISFNSPLHPGNVLGYRMFKDILGNTTYTRFSYENTTYLTQTLNPSDTEIYVADSSVLTAPIVEENKPGVVLINAERIEFYQVDGNVLKQITRGTLGTGINGILEYGAQVYDQGYNQEFTTSEVTDVQILYTDNGLPFYSIETEDFEVAVPNSTATISSKGITLDTNVSLIDQVEVYLGGRQLRKNRMYVHDTAVALDNIPLASIRGVVSTATLSSIVANMGDSYIDNESGQVWTYTRTRTDNMDAPGWVYSGMTRLEPEFTISVVGLAQYIYLNNDVEDGIEIAIVKKHSNSNDFNTVVTTGTTLPLWDSTTAIAMFLKDSTTALPTDYFKQADSVLRDEAGNPLTDENGMVLTGRV